MINKQPEERSPFQVHLNGQAARKAQKMSMDSTKIAEQEHALALDRQRLQEQEAQLQQVKEQAIAEERQEKMEKRSSLLDDAADWREMARTATNADKAKDYLRRAKEAEQEATQLGVELNLNEPATESTPAIIPDGNLSTGAAIRLILGLFVLFVGLTYLFGHPLEADPMNAIGQSMMKNAPIRALLSFTLTFLTFLVAVFFIRVCFPQFYRIWHNRIDSERSLETLLNEAPAWVVLLALLGLFYTFMQVFASYYQALYA